jgi:large subunit ribosomal protein L22
MSKPDHPRPLKDNEARAILRSVRISPQKLNLVAETIRGKTASAALAELTFSKRRIAVQVKKVLQSAIANAENNHQLDVDRLIVAEAHVGKSFQLRRFHARGRGKSASVVKPFSHLTVVVRERDDKKKADAAKAA